MIDQQQGKMLSDHPRFLELDPLVNKNGLNIMTFGV
jgi:hypothetical protein